MKTNKTLLTVFGLAAVAGGLWYIFRPKPTETDVVIPPAVPPVIPPVIPPTVPPVIPPTVPPVTTVPVPVIDKISNFAIGTKVYTTADTNLYQNANFQPITDWIGDFKQVKKNQYLGTIVGRSGAFTSVTNYSSSNPTGYTTLFILNSENVRKE
jgi:hypothetical protein